jgi:hypothetical protein
MIPFSVYLVDETDGYVSSEREGRTPALMETSEPPGRTLKGIRLFTDPDRALLVHLPLNTGNDHRVILGGGILAGACGCHNRNCFNSFDCAHN